MQKGLIGILKVWLLKTGSRYWNVVFGTGSTVRTTFKNMSIVKLEHEYNGIAIARNLKGRIYNFVLTTCLIVSLR